MAKTKISEFDSNPSNNTDIDGINIAEGCAPSGINNAIRELMSQLKDQQTGASDDNFTVGGNLAVDGTSTFTGAVTLTGGIVGGGFIPTGGIIIWSGAANAIPSGWLLCDGSNSTPDLRNRFVVGATSTYSVGATGGSADAIVVAHSHTGTTAAAGSHNHEYSQMLVGGNYLLAGGYVGFSPTGGQTTSTAGSHTHTITTDSTGSSGTNANLPPYYALCYIMKS